MADPTDPLSPEQRRKLVDDWLFPERNYTGEHAEVMSSIERRIMSSGAVPDTLEGLPTNGNGWFRSRLEGKGAEFVFLGMDLANKPDVQVEAKWRDGKWHVIDGETCDPAVLYEAVRVQTPEEWKKLYIQKPWPRPKADK